MCLTLSILLLMLQSYVTLLKQNGAENVNEFFDKLIERTDDKVTVHNEKKPSTNNSNIIYLNKVNKTYVYGKGRRIKPSMTVFTKQLQKNLDNQSNIIRRKISKPKATHKREQSFVEEEISIEEWSDVGGILVKNNPEITAETMQPLEEHILRSGSVEAEGDEVQKDEGKTNIQLNLDNETNSYLAQARNTFYNEPLLTNIHSSQHLSSLNDDKIIVDNVNYNVSERNEYLENVIKNSEINDMNVYQESRNQTNSENNIRFYEDIGNLIKDVVTEEPQSKNDEFRFAIESDTVTLKPSKNHEINREALSKCQSCVTNAQPLRYYYNYKRLFYPVILKSVIQPDLQTNILRQSLEKTTSLQKTRHIAFLNDLLKRTMPKINHRPSYNSYISY